MSELSLYEIAQKAKASGTRKGLALANRYSKIYAKASELGAKRSELDAKRSELVNELTAWADAAR